MKWFKHDANASTDAKIKKLIIRHGAEGYAVYFHCLELIVSDLEDTNVTFELEHDSEIIADNLKIRSEQGISAIDKVNNTKNKMTFYILCQYELKTSQMTLEIFKRLPFSTTETMQNKVFDFS